MVTSRQRIINRSRIISTLLRRSTYRLVSIIVSSRTCGEARHAWRRSVWRIGGFIWNTLQNSFEFYPLRLIGNIKRIILMWSRLKSSTLFSEMRLVAPRISSRTAGRFDALFFESIWFSWSHLIIEYLRVVFLTSSRKWSDVDVSGWQPQDRSYQTQSCSMNL